MTEVTDLKNIGVRAVSKILASMLDAADQMNDDAYRLVLQARAKEMLATVDQHTKYLVLQRLQKSYREVLTGEKVKSDLITPLE